MRLAAKALTIFALMLPMSAGACVCAYYGIHRDLLNHSKDLFLGKVLSVHANEELVEGHKMTTSISYEYRVEHVIRGSHSVGEIIKETAEIYGPTTCSRAPQMSADVYFLANSSFGYMCGLLEYPLQKISAGEREIIEQTQGGAEAVKWMEKNIPDFRFLTGTR